MLFWPADPASRPSCSLRAPSPPPPLLLTQSGGRPPAPISRCGPSTADGAIGKQRPEMRFPVSFPSLMDKRTKGSRKRWRNLLCSVVVLVSGSNWSRRAAPCHLLPLRDTSNFHFFPVHPVFGSSSRWRGGEDVISISSFISLPTQQSILWASLRALPCRSSFSISFSFHPAPDAADPCRLSLYENKDRKYTFLFHFLHR